MNDKLIDITIRVDRDTPISKLLSLPDWVEEIVIGGREIENGDYYEGLEEGIKIGKASQDNTNDWIPHTGTECPVHPLDVVEVRCKDGLTSRKGKAAGSFRWSKIGCVTDIASYRHVCDEDGIPYVYDDGDLP